MVRIITEKKGSARRYRGLDGARRKKRNHRSTQMTPQLLTDGFFICVHLLPLAVIQNVVLSRLRTRLSRYYGDSADNCRRVPTGIHRMNLDPSAIAGKDFISAAIINPHASRSSLRCGNNLHREEREERKEGQRRTKAGNFNLEARP